MQLAHDGIDADLLFGLILFLRRALDVPKGLGVRAFVCSELLSQLPFVSGYDGPKKLFYQITLFGPIRADVRHLTNAPKSCDPLCAARFI